MGRIAAVVALVMAVFLPASVFAGAIEADDRAALAGLKEVRGAFDITEGSGEKLLLRLNLIDETRRSLIAQGVTPRFVLAFRGGATRLVQTDLDILRPEEREVAKKIAGKIREMKQAPGVERLEQCSVAVRLQETRVDRVLPEITVVGNGWISLMAYQSKGYAYIYP